MSAHWSSDVVSASKDMTTDLNDNETLIILAKWAESAERYDDMADYMKKVSFKRAGILW